MNPSQTEVLHNPLHWTETIAKALRFVREPFQKAVLEDERDELQPLHVCRQISGSG